ncbi:MAG: cadherin repeat domain-containing protein, partial [Pirellulaceae bacterium]
IAENSPANTTVGTLSTIDPDAGDTFTYSLVAGTGDTDNSAFNISGSTLRAASSFDFEAQSSYTVRIRSTDQRGLSTEKPFTIAVTNVVVGDLDNTFDGDGKVTTDLGSSADFATSVAIQSDGKIVDAG